MVWGCFSGVKMGSNMGPLKLFINIVSLHVFKHCFRNHLLNKSWKQAVQGSAVFHTHTHTNMRFVLLQEKSVIRPVQEMITANRECAPDFSLTPNECMQSRCVNTCRYARVSRTSNSLALCFPSSLFLFPCSGERDPGNGLVPASPKVSVLAAYNGTKMVSVVGMLWGNSTQTVMAADWQPNRRMGGRDSATVWMWKTRYLNARVLTHCSSSAEENISRKAGWNPLYCAT